MRVLRAQWTREPADELVRAYTGARHFKALAYSNRVARRPRRLKPRRVNGRLRARNKR